MSRSAPLLGLVAGTAIAITVVLATAGVGTGCATQETTPAPDAALPPCDRGPFIFCQPVADDVPGCNTDDGDSRWLSRLPRDTRYPVGCTINYVGDRNDQGDCELEAVCRCVAGGTVSPPPPPDDGGSDPDASADAAVPPPPPPPSDAGPVWSCYP